MNPWPSLESREALVKSEREGEPAFSASISPLSFTFIRASSSRTSATTTGHSDSLRCSSLKYDRLRSLLAPCQPSTSSATMDRFIHERTIELFGQADQAHVKYEKASQPGHRALPRKLPGLAGLKKTAIPQHSHAFAAALM